jgi:hypothetical protein
MALKGIRENHIIVIGYHMRLFMPKPIGEEGTGDVAVIDVSLEFGKLNWDGRII